MDISFQSWGLFEKTFFYSPSRGSIERRIFIFLSNITLYTDLYLFLKSLVDEKIIPLGFLSTLIMILVVCYWLPFIGKQFKAFCEFIGDGIAYFRDCILGKKRKK